ncbi:hypothetical protein HK100_007098 [Physocladia obscura]|uniref:Peroxidase n=1 Tax=Physocladia obscura TaxID=109957 RepID=A0AAD5SPV1_9FUNG|nr:hypothetical protein HK100_007098 [Physocladia obscura]
MAALWLRSVFHDAGTYDSTTTPTTGGLDASLALAAEYDDPANDGLAAGLATRFMPVANNISKADFIALGGVVAVAHCGGPQAAYAAGRADASVPNDLARLPSNTALPESDVKAAFARMGLDAVDMLVLITGSHSLGGAHAAISPNLTSLAFDPFDDTPGVFDNHIFQRVLTGKCVVPIDCKLAEDPELLPYIQT